MKVPKMLVSLRDAADRIQNALLIILITVVSLLVFVQVVLRYVFHAPLMGIEELLLFPTAWLFMIGAVKASSEKTQIVARVLEIFLKSPKAISLLRAVAALISGGVLLWLSRWGWDYLKYLIRMEKESPTLYIPTIWYEGIVFFALVLMTVYTFIEFFEHINHFCNNTAAQLRQEGDDA